ncbi:hypothetical protein PISMIDRAFT_18725 [Pisolithus microcarpus 441]|uniref:Uncharacterized protein n=1 Tax=Pisolithus microcarpus 441 TaxID=765257 RepID=A0A0C9YF04_9AGAM|nr:hypothetical protein PISMIDRAFT_18725 [Pisolithus microcarpus 441]
MQASKVTQVLKFFELEVTCAQEDKQAAEDVRVADQEAKADAKEAEEIMHKKVQKFNAIHTRVVQYHT